MLQKLLIEYDDRDALTRPTPTEDLCLTCLTVKGRHVEHCKRCERCVKDFHLHSVFFNKCIGQNNCRAYMLFLTTSFWLFLCYILQLAAFSQAYQQSQASNWLFKVLEVHFTGVVHLQMELILPLLFAEYYILHLSDHLLMLYVAVSRAVTVNELKQPWLYKYLFQHKDTTKEYYESEKSCGRGKSGKKEHVYDHKQVNLCLSIWNIIRFFLGCKLDKTQERNPKRKNDVRQRVREEIEGKKDEGKNSYVELAVMDTKGGEVSISEDTTDQI